MTLRFRYAMYRISQIRIENEWISKSILLTPSSIKNHDPVVINNGLKPMSDCDKNAILELFSDDFLDSALIKTLV